MVDITKERRVRTGEEEAPTHWVPNPLCLCLVHKSFRLTTFLLILLHIEENETYTTARVTHDERSE